MPTFDDLGEALAPTLDLPVAGRIYKVPSPPAVVGLRMQALFSGAAAHRLAGVPASKAMVLDDEQEIDLYRDALGPVHAEMVDDGCTLEQIKHAGMTAFIWHVAGVELARTYWQTPAGGTPKATG